MQFQVALKNKLASHNGTQQYKQWSDVWRKLVYTETQAFQPSSVPNVEMTLTTAHQLGRNGTPNNRDSKYRDSTVYTSYSYNKTKLMH